MDVGLPKIQKGVQTPRDDDRSRSEDGMKTKDDFNKYSEFPKQGD